MKVTSRILALLLALLTLLSAFTVIGCSDEGKDSGEETQAPEATETKPQKTEPDYYGTSWINAEEFGFVGDGQTANDAVFAKYIHKYNYIPLYFPAGVYCFEDTLNFPDSMFVRLDPKAELKCIAKEPLDFFITLRGQFATASNQWVPFLDYAHQAGIEGGTVNCDYKAKCAIGLFQGMQSMFRDLKVMNVLEKGIQTKNSLTSDGCYHFENIYVYNTKSLPGTYGIYDNHVDNHFMYVTVVNFETSFYTHGGRFVECSGWNIDMANVEKLTFAEVKGDQSIWIGPSVDTVRYGFKLHAGASTSISDLVYITNKGFYTDALQQKYPRTLFVADDPAQAKFMVTGLQIRWEQNLDFSNAQLPMSTFLNVRIPDGCNGPILFKNFRDDSAALRQGGAAGSVEPKFFYVTGKSDFDTLTVPGVYVCSLTAGKGGKNLPPILEKGTLNVYETDGRYLQTFYGETYMAFRTFDGVNWSEWTVTSRY